MSQDQLDQTAPAAAGSHRPDPGGFPVGPPPPLPDTVRNSRRLPERILVAAHQACDLGALDVAHALLCVMNDVIRQTGAGAALANRRAIEGMVAAHQRLWHLRNPGADGG